MTPATPLMFRPFGDPIEQLKRQDAAARNFAQCAGEFLESAFPAASSESIHRMRDAWIDFICCGTQEQIEQIEESRKQVARYPSPIYLGPSPQSDEEQLMALIEERDKLTTRIEQALQNADKVPDGAEFMNGIIEEAFINPLRQQLEFTEQRISRLQNDIEQRAHAEPSVITTAEKSANASGAD